ncbi:MAG: hypothetical protein EXR92_01170 [Gemmatimonadetes bacterium]|nr:hypothetical protein [Gemmatimonadota bacterium]
MAWEAPWDLGSVTRALKTFSFLGMARLYGGSAGRPRGTSSVDRRGFSSLTWFAPQNHRDASPMYLLVFDFDSTLVSVEGLDELFARSLTGHPEQASRIQAFREVTDLGMAGTISAEESLNRRLAILDVDRATVDTVAAEIREKVTPSVAKHASFFRENAKRIHVVSGGFEELIQPTLGRLGLPLSQLHAHRFQYSKGRVVGLDPTTAMARGGKVGIVGALGSGSEPMPIWIVGDGATDFEVKERGFAERFVAFTENRWREPVVATADHVVGSMDELLQLLEDG